MRGATAQVYLLLRLPWEGFEIEFCRRKRMTKTRILVLGRSGQVGWELRHKLACLGQVTAVDYPEIDFSKPDSIR